MKDRIEELMLRFVAVRTDTGTAKERNAEAFFADWFEEVPYFREHKEYRGFFSIPDDHLSRKIPWCLRKGMGNSTVVLIHHSDCVAPDDYGILDEASTLPWELDAALKEGKRDIPNQVKEDLFSEEWIFGLGPCDMKGGAAVQMALMEKYCQDENFHGNVVMLSVPDEENLSAGMRGGVLLLDELKSKYNLNYVLMLNSEPHGRTDNLQPVVYTGSIGKIMPVVYVRGRLAHGASAFQGLNPIALLAEIICKTELEKDFLEEAKGVVTPPPTWLYAKDSKDVYDVSLPLSACGYMNILTFNRTPKSIIDKLKSICENAFMDSLERMNTNHTAFLKLSGQEPHSLPWKVNVKLYEELYEEAKRESGKSFEEDYATTMEKIITDFHHNKMSLIDGINKLINKTFEYIKDDSPIVVVALAPPYYPNVANSMLKGDAVLKVNSALNEMIDFAKTQLGQEYQIAPYFTGISDLSYGMFVSDGDGVTESINCIQRNMLFWTSLYYVPLETIEKLSMPVLNIGPWGKDFHKYTERVFKEDLYDKTPKLIDFMVSKVLTP